LPVSNEHRPLPRSFYTRNVVEVARDLLGMILCRRISGNLLSGRIVEAEAYSHRDDPASHAYKGPTERNRVMWGEPGRAYVYFTYGNHYCLNVVARQSEPAGAVLIRALEPMTGIEMMMKSRGVNDVVKLASGPGRLTQALSIGPEFNGVDLTAEGDLMIVEGEGFDDASVQASRRIGLRVGLDKLWRFSVRGNRFVSRTPDKG